MGKLGFEFPIHGVGYSILQEYLPLKNIYFTAQSYIRRINSIVMVRTVPICKNNEFVRIYKRGQFFVGKFIILYVFKNGSSENRLGVTVSKKVGKSVKRNRIRRLIKENYRYYEEFVKTGFDFVFVARSYEVIPNFMDIKKEMKFLFKRLNVFDQEKWDCLKRH